MYSVGSFGFVPRAKTVQGTGSQSETDRDTRKIDEIESDTPGVGGSGDIDGLVGRRVDRIRVGGSVGNIDGAGRNSEDADKELQNKVESGYSQQFLNNDVLETIIKITLLAFPFMRLSLRAVNSFFGDIFSHGRKKIVICHMCMTNI